MAATANKSSSGDPVSSDLACTRCRERKIRCGRERPQCSNCERDGGDACRYQTPTKRVNHIKLLCDNVDRLDDRLKAIELHLGRLSDTITPSAFVNASDDSDAGGSQYGARRRPGRSSRRSSDVQSNEDDDDDEANSDLPRHERDGQDDVSDASAPLADENDAANLHIFRSPVDMADRYHGPSSLFALCNQLRLRLALNLNTTESTADSSSIFEALQDLCNLAGTSEPFLYFPPDQGFMPLLPKAQVAAALERFFANLSVSSDLFVRSNIEQNFHRLYSQNTKPGDDAWATCFRVITLLVLGLEISSQAQDALFSGFVSSLLPSRAALVNTHLLTTPRLINVQTLILLSVVAQQFDPAGWAEVIFAHACMLARTMGLHHAQAAHESCTDVEVVERAKVLQALYCRDKSLCMTRGTVAWLPSSDCNLPSDTRAAPLHEIDRPIGFRLATIQDRVYQLTSAESRVRLGSSRRLQAELKSLEEALEQFVHVYDVFHPRLLQSSQHTQIAMEYLTTRVLALHSRQSKIHADELYHASRTCCLLFLIANGERDEKTVGQFKSLVPNGREQSPLPAIQSAPFMNILDSFSLPAFFALLDKAVIQKTTHGQAEQADEDDFGLLHRVSACYTASTSRMQPNSYHWKVAWILDRLITIADKLCWRGQPARDKTMQGADSVDIAMSTPSLVAADRSVESISLSISPGNDSDSGALMAPSHSWDDWLSLPSHLLPNTPIQDLRTTETHELLLQTRATDQLSVGQPTEILDKPHAKDTPTASFRKRARVQSDIGTPTEMIQGSFDIFLPFEEIPFNLIS